MKRLLFGRLLPSLLLLAIVGMGLVLIALYLPRALAPLSIAERAVSLLIALLLAASRLPAERKIRRLLFLLLPWVGLLTVFPVRRPVPPPAPCSVPALGDEISDTISKISYSGCKLSGCRASSARYFSSGKEMREQLLKDLLSAEKEILLDFYLLARGKFFDGVLEILEEKAHRGVDVNLIYDDFGCSLTLPRKFKEELLKRGIKTTIFHPIRPFPLGMLNRRDHRKLIVIDRRIAYTGGVNLADEYIGEKIRFGHWKDCAVRLEGEPAERFAALFHGRVQTFLGGRGSPCVVFGDGVRRNLRTGEEIFFKLITSAKESLHLCTPYLAPSEKISSALRSAALSGVEIKLLIPHMPDKKWVFALTRARGRELAAAGVEVREYTAGFLHAKSLTTDGEYAVVGSYNLDERSLLCQAECGVFLKDRSFCEAVERDFSSCFEIGVAIPKPRFPEKFAAFWMKIFCPLI